MLMTMCWNGQAESWCVEGSGIRQSVIIVITAGRSCQLRSSNAATAATNVSDPDCTWPSGTSHRTSRRPAADVEPLGPGVWRTGTRGIQASGYAVQRVWSVVGQKNSARTAQDWYRTQEGTSQYSWLLPSFFCVILVSVWNFFCFSHRCHYHIPLLFSVFFYVTHCHSLSSCCISEHFLNLILRQNYVIFGVQFERRKVDEKANLHENWNMQTVF